MIHNNLERFLESCKLTAIMANKSLLALTDDIKFVFDIIPIEETVNIELQFYSHSITLNTFPLQLSELENDHEMTNIYNMAKNEIKQYSKLINKLVKEL